MYTQKCVCIHTHIHIFLICTRICAHTYIILRGPEEKKHFLRVSVSAVVKEGKLQTSHCLWFPSCARCIAKMVLNKARNVTTLSESFMKTETERFVN